MGIHFWAAHSQIPRAIIPKPHQPSSHQPGFHYPSSLEGIQVELGI